jgi:hypothetical protein
MEFETTDSATWSTAACGCGGWNCTSGALAYEARPRTVSPRISSKRSCRRGDSNPYYMVSQTIDSAVGLRRLGGSAGSCTQMDPRGTPDLQSGPVPLLSKLPNSRGDRRELHPLDVVHSHAPKLFGLDHQKHKRIVRLERIELPSIAYRATALTVRLQADVLHGPGDWGCTNGLSVPNRAFYY